MSRTVTNAPGEPLSYSGSSTAWFSASASGPVLYGTAGNDSMWADSSTDVTMIGGTGDDIYYLYSGANRASEAPGAGLDTIKTWMSYSLPENFENLTVTALKVLASAIVPTTSSAVAQAARRSMVAPATTSSSGRVVQTLSLSKGATVAT